MNGETTNLGRVYLAGADPAIPGFSRSAPPNVSAAPTWSSTTTWSIRRRSHARPGAELVGLGHHGTGRHVSQEQINAEMIAAARQGKTVVRLKAGDPCVFGCLAEEIAALRAAGVPLEIIPGATAGLAVAAYAELPVTHAQAASAVALITGHQRKEKSSPPMDYRALGSFPGTLIFYMGVTSVGQWSEALIAGENRRTRRWPSSAAARGPIKRSSATLATVAATLAAREIRPPAVFVVGETAALAPESSWFSQRPLFGVGVLVTRPAEQAHELCDRLADLGANVYVQPAVAIGPPPDWAAVDAALARLDQCDWLVFSSGNGVRWFLDRLLAGGGDLRRLGGVKLAAIGPGTAAELAKYRLQADLMPEEYRAESLAEALLAQAPRGRFLLARADRGRQVLPERLLAAGATVDQVVAYSTREIAQADPEIAAALTEGRIDWVTVTSSAIARSLAALFGAACTKYDWPASARSLPGCLANWATLSRPRRKSTRWPAWSRRFWRPSGKSRR